MDRVPRCDVDVRLVPDHPARDRRGAVAIRLCDDDYVETDNCGYIRILGVLEDFRGRGLAKFLLRDAFASDAAEGRAGTILDVDTSNPTPALDLYLSVGMKPTLVSEGWRRVVPVS